MRAVIVLGVIFTTAYTVASPTEFKSIAGMELKSHADGKPSLPTNGTKMTQGATGVILDCDFTTVGHDAAWIEFPCELLRFDELILDRTISDGRQQLFVVLTDAKDESHLFRFEVTGSGRQKVKAVIQAKNMHPGERFAWRWGGNDDQTIDWPVKKVAIGVNDTPDTYVGRVTLLLHSFEARRLSEGT